MGNRNAQAGASLLLLTTIALGMFLDGLDGTIVNVALPDISESFGMDSSMSSWIVTVYFLVLAGLVLIFGKLCDSGAIKKVLISGFLVFSLASLVCGLSYDIVVLLAARAVQGIGASMLAASSVMLSVKFLPPHMTSFGVRPIRSLNTAPEQLQFPVADSFPQSRCFSPACSPARTVSDQISPSGKASAVFNSS